MNNKDKKDDQILVSIICTAYNHEKYIRDCLEGFVQQEASFKYEVLIHDDASTDCTASIIQEYQRKYPEIIKPIYQEQNQHSRNVRIVPSIVFPMATGKYVAFCEGDDYWIDPHKLQKQINILECNKDVDMCVHRVMGVSEDRTHEIQPYPLFILEEGILTDTEFLAPKFARYPFQTSSYFFRASSLNRFFSEYPHFVQVSPVGDQCYLLYYACHGGIFYSPDTMSHYRMDSYGSWSQRVTKKPEKMLNHHIKMIEMFTEFDQYTNNKYHDYCVYRIWHQKLSIARIQNDSSLFKDLFKGENLSVLMTYGIKIRLSLFASAYLPHLIGFYRTVKSLSEYES